MIKHNCLPVLDHFLCGYSLQTGAIFTGWLSLGADVLQLLASVAYFIVYGRQIPDWQLLLFSEVGASLIAGSVYGLLLYGAYKKKPSFVVPYLILVALSIISSAVAIIGFGIEVFFYSPELAVTILLIGGLSAGLSAYLWLVVYNYHQQLKKYSLSLNVAEDDDYMSHHKFVSWKM